MRIDCTINGKARSFDVDPLMKLREMLLLNGNFAVRDSDDAEGFCGSDTVSENAYCLVNHRDEDTVYHEARSLFDSHRSLADGGA